MINATVARGITIHTLAEQMTIKRIQLEVVVMLYALLRADSARPGRCVQRKRLTWRVLMQMLSNGG